MSRVSPNAFLGQIKKTKNMRKRKEEFGTGEGEMRPLKKEEIAFSWIGPGT